MAIDPNAFAAGYGPQSPLIPTDETMKGYGSALGGNTPVSSMSGYADAIRGLISGMEQDHQAAQQNMLKSLQGGGKNTSSMFGKGPAGAVPFAGAGEAVGGDAYQSRVFQLESNNNPYAVTGSYRGLGQFALGEYGINKDNWTDYQAQRDALAAERTQNSRFIGANAPDWMHYMAHQQGAGGVRAHTANPDAPAWVNMLNTAEGREKGAGWAKQAIWGNMTPQMKAQFPNGVETVPSRAFMAMWQDRYNGGPGSARPAVTSDVGPTGGPGSQFAANWPAPAQPGTITGVTPSMAYAPETLNGGTSVPLDRAVTRGPDLAPPSPTAAPTAAPAPTPAPGASGAIPQPAASAAPPADALAAAAPPGAASPTMASFPTATVASRYATAMGTPPVAPAAAPAAPPPAAAPAAPEGSVIRPGSWIDQITGGAWTKGLPGSFAPGSPPASGSAAPSAPATKAPSPQEEVKDASIQLPPTRKPEAAPAPPPAPPPVAAQPPALPPAVAPRQVAAPPAAPGAAPPPAPGYAGPGVAPHPGGVPGYATAQPPVDPSLLFPKFSAQDWRNAWIYGDDATKQMMIEKTKPVDIQTPDGSVTRYFPNGNWVTLKQGLGAETPIKMGDMTIMGRTVYGPGGEPVTVMPRIVPAGSPGTPGGPPGPLPGTAPGAGAPGYHAGQEGVLGGLSQIASEQAGMKAREAATVEAMKEATTQRSKIGQSARVAFQELPQIEELIKLMDNPAVYTGILHGSVETLSQALGLAGATNDTATMAQLAKKLGSRAVMEMIDEQAEFGAPRVQQMNLAKQSSFDPAYTKNANKAVAIIGARVMQRQIKLDDLANQYSAMKGYGPGVIDAGFQQYAREYFSRPENDLFTPDEKKNINALFAGKDRSTTPGPAPTGGPGGKAGTYDYDPATNSFKRRQ